MTLAERLADHGIRPKSFTLGNHRLTCPRCSAQRKKKTDPCLSLTIEDDGGAAWSCWHCGYSDGFRAGNDNAASVRPRAPSRPPKQPAGPDAKVIEWFAKRGISENIVRRNRIGFERHWIPALGAEADCIAIPYYRDGRLANVKYRTIDGKEFAQSKGGERLFYGLDDIDDDKIVIVVEGEIDKLALEVAGFRNVLSVPDGSPEKLKDGEPSKDDGKFQFLANSESYIAHVTTFVLATDSDGPGQVLETELARRLGRERCKRVRWPNGNDAATKDANEALQVHGAKVVRECIEAAEDYPIRGLHAAGDYRADVLSLYRDGRARGHSTGWPGIDSLMTIRPGELSVVTGYPGSGKSEFIDALAVNLAHKYGWRFGVCSFENPPEEHLAKLAEKHLATPFWEGPTPRMDESELNRALDWAANHFWLIRADDDAPTIDLILDAARGAVLRHGIRGLVIDPYNEIEHKRPDGMTETEYVSQMLGKVRRFARDHDLHVWFVAHPAKQFRDKQTGTLPVPTLYDISGSANWVNKADIGLVVHREYGDARTQIHVRKVRFKSVGQPGSTFMQYDRATGCYSEDR
jgi:twinkle protein